MGQRYAGSPEPATFERCALIRDWLDDHGVQHRRLRAGRGRRRGEFVGLDGAETRRAVLAGRRVLKLAGIDARGFVAPGYAYTNALRQTLATTFDWWAGIGRLHRSCGGAPTTAPALALGTTSAFTRWSSPRVVRAGAMLSGDLLRLDLHPADLDHPRHIGAVEKVLRRAHQRSALTYDELAGV